MKINTTDEILELYGVDFKDVKGYEGLTDANKEIYKTFIVNLYNAWGSESRETLVPMGIYWVEHNEHLTKEDPEDEGYLIIGSTIYSIDKEGNKVLHRKWISEGSEDSPILETDKSEYLRFEYKHRGRKEWLHVIKDGKEWY